MNTLQSLSNAPEGATSVLKVEDDTRMLKVVKAPLVPSITIWTMQLGKWRVAQKENIAILDTTAKSGIQAFAPDFDTVMRYKRGELSQERYTEIYLHRMAQSKIRDARKWEELGTEPRVAIACYCRAGVFCHRHLFRDLMTADLQERGIEVIHAGELT